MKALDAHTLQVELTSPQPWFVQQVAHTSFLAVNRKAVEKYGDKWTEAKNIVTNGPFKLASWQHDSRIDLVKWADWRDAGQVSLQRVNGRMISDGTTAVQAFEAGEVDVTGTVPAGRDPAPEGHAGIRQVPGSRHLLLRVQRQEHPGRAPAPRDGPGDRPEDDHRQHRPGRPGAGHRLHAGRDARLRLDQPESPWLPASGDIDKAKQLMSQVKSPKKSITLWYNEDPSHKAIAVAVQSMWKQLGIDVTLKAQEFAQYLQFLGPPPNKAVDAFRLGWIGDYVDAMNFLEQWTCGSGNNNTNYCDKSYDALVAQARNTPDNEKRYELYGQLEEKLLGQDGAVPIVPIYWYTYTQLEKHVRQGHFNLNLLDQVDLTKVKVEG